VSVGILGTHLTAGAGVAVVSLRSRSSVSGVPLGRVPALRVRPSPGSAGLLLSVPPGPEPASVQDLELTSVWDLELTSGQGPNWKDGGGRAEEACGGRDRLPGP